VFPVPPATLRMLSNAHVAPICEERRQADVLAEDAGLGEPGLEGAVSGGTALAQPDGESAGLPQQDGEA
jgi:hypothetical protein